MGLKARVLKQKSFFFREEPYSLVRPAIRASEAIKMKYSPVAILWTGERPEKALQFKEGR